MNGQYDGEYDESIHDADWYALGNRSEYDRLVYGDYDDDYDYDDYGYDYDD